MSTAIHLRPLGLTDQAFFREMFYHSLHVPPGGTPFPREILDSPALNKYLVPWGLPGDYGQIAMQDEKAIGAIWCRLIKGYGFVDENTPELGIAILPEWRGQGIGSALFQAFFQQVSAAGYARLSLSVSKTNLAFRLYQRLGFVVVGEDEHSWTMLKSWPQ